MTSKPLSIKATYQGKAQFSLRNHFQIKTKRYTYQVFGEMVLWSHCRILHCLDNRKKFKLTTSIIMQGNARSFQKRVVCKWQFMEASMITLVDIECSWIFYCRVSSFLKNRACLLVEVLIVCWSQENSSTTKAKHYLESLCISQEQISNTLTGFKLQFFV